MTMTTAYYDDGNFSLAQHHIVSLSIFTHNLRFVTHSILLFHMLFLPFRLMQPFILDVFPVHSPLCISHQWMEMEANNKQTEMLVRAFSSSSKLKTHENVNIIRFSFVSILVYNFWRLLLCIEHLCVPYRYK